MPRLNVYINIPRCVQVLQALINNACMLWYWCLYLAEWLMVVAQVSHQGGLPLNVSACDCLHAGDALHPASLTLAKIIFWCWWCKTNVVFVPLPTLCVCVCVCVDPCVCVYACAVLHLYVRKMQALVSLCVCVRVRHCVTKEHVGKVLSGGKCCWRGGGATVAITPLRSRVSISAHVHKQIKKKGKCSWNPKLDSMFSILK